jgi:hypothetical protein
MIASFDSGEFPGSKIHFIREFAGVSAHSVLFIIFIDTKQWGRLKVLQLN